MAECIPKKRPGAPTYGRDQSQSVVAPWRTLFTKIRLAGTLSTPYVTRRKTEPKQRE